MAKKGELTPKQAVFVREYLIDLNATQAAIRAGYSEKTAQEIGAQNLSKLILQEAIQKAMDKRAERTEITADKVLEGIFQLAAVDLAECYNENGTLKNIHDIPKSVRLAMAGIDVTEEFQRKGESRELIGYTKKVKFWDKNKAFENLGRHLKLFTDKHEIRTINSYEDLTDEEKIALAKSLEGKGTSKDEENKP